MRFFSIVSVMSCCLLLFLPLLSRPHPYYIGLSELQFYPTEKRMELSIRLFTDDFESALLKSYGTSSDLLKGVNKPEINEKIKTYLRQKVKIKLGTEQLQLSYIGYEIEADASWCHFEATFTSPATQISFQNRALFEVLPEQQHIVHVKAGDNRKSARLNRENDELSWKW